MTSNDIASHFLSFYLTGLSAQANHVWRGMWLALTKAIWMHRNKVIFEGGQVDKVEIFLQAQLQAWSWVRFEGIRFQKTFAEWCMHLVDCLREVK